MPDASKLNRLTDEDIENAQWYYQIELRPGVFSGGRVRGTSSMTRKVVANTALEGLRCLDVGAQEGLLAVLMARQGAKRVAAYDRLNLSDRLDLVKEAYDVDMDYYHSLPLHELPSRLSAEDVPAFDVVVFAGVLYHMMDPLAGLAAVRSLVRNGGLVVVETSVLASDEYVLHFNAGGRYYSGSNYFQVSLASLDYFLRMMRLKPIDMLFTEPGKNQLCRTTLVCRALPDCIPEPGDAWMSRAWIEKDALAFGLDFSAMTTTGPDVPYVPTNDSLVFREGTDCVDAVLTLKASPPHRSTATEGQLRLGDVT